MQFREATAKENQAARDLIRAAVAGVDYDDAQKPAFRRAVPKLADRVLSRLVRDVHYRRHLLATDERGSTAGNVLRRALFEKSDSLVVTAEAGRIGSWLAASPERLLVRHPPAPAGITKISIDDPGVAYIVGEYGAAARMAAFLAFHRYPALAAKLEALPPRTRVGYAAKLAVKEEFKGRGVGRLLLRSLIAEFRRAGVKRVYMHPQPEYPEDRRLLYSFYKREGFEGPYRGDSSAGEPRAIMEAPIEQLAGGARGPSRPNPAVPTDEPFAPFPDSVVQALVYHGTDQRYDELARMPGKRSIGGFGEYVVQAGGLFFSPTLETARTYGRNVLAAYIDIQDPLLVPGDQRFDVDRAKDVVTLLEPFIRPPAAGQEWRYYGTLAVSGYEKEIYRSDADEHFPEWPSELIAGRMGLTWRVLDHPEVGERLAQLGYDGTSVAEPHDEEGYSWFVASPSQVRWRWVEQDGKPVVRKDIGPMAPSHPVAEEFVREQLAAATRLDDAAHFTLLGGRRIEDFAFHPYELTFYEQPEPRTSPFFWNLTELRTGRIVGTGLVYRDSKRKTAAAWVAVLAKPHRQRMLYQTILRVLRDVLGTPLDSGHSLTKGAIGAWQRAGGVLVLDDVGALRYRLQ